MDEYINANALKCMEFGLFIFKFMFTLVIYKIILLEKIKLNFVEIGFQFYLFPCLNTVITVEISRRKKGLKTYSLYVNSIHLPCRNTMTEIRKMYLNFPKFVIFMLSELITNYLKKNYL